MKRYKFLREGFKSQYGEHTWEIGKWYKCNQELSLCNIGFHCSKGIYQAFSYVQGELLAEVEVRGSHLEEDDKEVWSEMRVTKCYEWTKIDSVLFSIYAAYLCLDSFEKLFPEDKGPRQAIEAAERYTKNPTEENRLAAESAAWSAAWSAARSAAESAARSAAESAARSAAWSAESARSAAESAAWSAAWSAARSAAESAARSAAWSAAWSARSATYKKLDKWMLGHKKNLKEIKQ